jgi:hypothetical protein
MRIRPGDTNMRVKGWRATRPDDQGQRHVRAADTDDREQRLADRDQSLGNVELVGAGALPNDGKVIADERYNLARSTDGRGHEHRGRKVLFGLTKRNLSARPARSEIQTSQAKIRTQGQQRSRNSTTVCAH